MNKYASIELLKLSEATNIEINSASLLAKLMFSARNVKKQGIQKQFETAMTNQLTK